jgi:protocatechuate 3,4-dioxygenase beta subunit
LGTLAPRRTVRNMTGTTSREPRPASDSALVLPRYLREEEGARTPLNYAGYRSTALRAPLRTPVDLPHRLTEVTAPVLGEDRVGPQDADLTLRMGGEAQGQRIIVYGRVLDSDGRPVPDALVEVWQANAGGRYRHVVDNWPAPLDPHFDGLGRVVTDSLGRYEFTTIKPGAYPWGNHHNAWRPAHIHFSLFGRAFTQRLVTQMYFPDDPLFGQDPIFQSMPTVARHRAISRFDLERTQPNWALAFQWDIVLRGTGQTPFENDDDGDVA